MASEERAFDLARTMVALGAEHGVRTRAFVTRMDTPLGRTVGNALEVAEAIEALSGEGPDDLMEITLTLARHMLERATGLLSELTSYAAVVVGPSHDSATIRSVSAAELTSAVMKTTSPPSRPRSAAAAAPASGSRPTTARRAPASTNVRAMPLPMPLVPPVTRTTRPVTGVNTMQPPLVRSVS